MGPHPSKTPSESWSEPSGLVGVAWAAGGQGKATCRPGTAPPCSPAPGLPPLPARTPFTPRSQWRPGAAVPTPHLPTAGGGASARGGASVAGGLCSSSSLSWEGHALPAGRTRLCQRGFPAHPLVSPEQPASCPGTARALHATWVPSPGRRRPGGLLCGWRLGWGRAQVQGEAV